MKNITQAQPAFTIIELLVVLAIVAILAGMLMPAIRYRNVRSTRVQCVINLKNLGTAYRLFANDNNGLFPSQISSNQGGTSDQLFKYFQMLSNKLSSTKILVCPADKRQAASNFLTLDNSKLSYFVGLDAVSNQSAMFLVGDRNIMLNGVSLSNQVSTVKTNDVLGWTAEQHNQKGNFGLADGSVWQVESHYLAEQMRAPGTAQRLSVP